jgi:hypothetical protein
MYRQVAIYAGRILRSEKPAKFPAGPLRASGTDTRPAGPCTCRARRPIHAKLPCRARRRPQAPAVRRSERGPWGMPRFEVVHKQTKLTQMHPVIICDPPFIRHPMQPRFIPAGDLVQQWLDQTLGARSAEPPEVFSERSKPAALPKRSRQPSLTTILRQARKAGAAASPSAGRSSISTRCQAKPRRPRPVRRRIILGMTCSRLEAAMPRIRRDLPKHACPIRDRSGNERYYFRPWRRLHGRAPLYWLTTDPISRRRCWGPRY